MEQEKDVSRSDQSATATADQRSGDRAVTKHTPGPWAIAPHSSNDETRDIVAGYEEVQEGGRTVIRADWIAELDAQMDFDSDREEQFQRLDANAHLIAAAPNYHEAMEHAKLDASELDGDNAGYVAITVEAWNMLKAAHAKAEGRS